MWSTPNRRPCPPLQGAHLQGSLVAEFPAALTWHDLSAPGPQNTPTPTFCIQEALSPVVCRTQTTVLLQVPSVPSRHRPECVPLEASHRLRCLQRCQKPTEGLVRVDGRGPVWGSRGLGGALGSSPTLQTCAGHGAPGHCPQGAPAPRWRRLVTVTTHDTWGWGPALSLRSHLRCEG